MKREKSEREMREKRERESLMVRSKGGRELNGGDI